MIQPAPRPAAPALTLCPDCKVSLVQGHPKRPRSWTCGKCKGFFEVCDCGEKGCARMPLRVR